MALWDLKPAPKKIWVGTSPNSKTKKKIAGTRFEIKTKRIFRLIIQGTKLNHSSLKQNSKTQILTTHNVWQNFKKKIFLLKKIDTSKQISCTQGSLLQSCNVCRQIYGTKPNFKNWYNQASTHFFNNFQTNPYSVLKKILLYNFFLIHIGLMGIHGVVSFGHRPGLRGPFLVSCGCTSENISAFCQGIYCVVSGPALLTAPGEIVFSYKSIGAKEIFEVRPEENNRSAGICFSQQRLGGNGTEENLWSPKIWSHLVKKIRRPLKQHTKLSYTKLNFNTAHFTVLHSTTLHTTTLHHTIYHYTTPHSTTLRLNTTIAISEK